MDMNKKLTTALCILLMSISILSGCGNDSIKDTNAVLKSNEVAETIALDKEQIKNEETLIAEDSLEGNKLIEVDGGNQSGHREPNVVVDIGYGDREYYAYTNEYGQLVKVTAK
jgi:hypothetical protein